MSGHRGVLLVRAPVLSPRTFGVSLCLAVLAFIASHLPDAGLSRRAILSRHMSFRCPCLLAARLRVECVARACVAASQILNTHDS